MSRAPRRSQRDLLDDIMTWGDRLAGHIAGLSKEAFLTDPLAQDAACRCIEVVGEAARNLMRADPEIAKRSPGLALPAAYGARNWIAHGYAVVDYWVVWKTASESVPSMVAAARLLMDEGSVSDERPPR